MTNPVRAFVALSLPTAVKIATAQLQRQLQEVPGAAAVRWLPDSQLHLTLRFLGNIPAETVPHLQAALQTATAGIKPFRLQLSGLGCFPQPSRPRIIWIGLAGDLPPLHQLQSAVAATTRPWGEPEDRPFHPHLTLGRVPPERTHAARRLTARFPPTPPATPPWEVGTVDLMQSQLHPAGAIYTRLASLPL